MTNLQDAIIQDLESLPDTHVALWKNSDLLCVYFKGKEVAHFQNDHEIDIRLTPSLIKQQGLVPPKDTKSHTNRAKGSRWIVQSFHQTEDISEIIRLVDLASTLV